MLLHMVFDMVAGMVADMATNKKRKLIFLFLADMLLHMGADKVAGMVAVMADGMVADRLCDIHPPDIHHPRHSPPPM